MSHLQIHEIQTSQRAVNTEETPITKIDEDVSMNLKLEKRITKTIITNIGKNKIQYKSIDHYGNTIPLGSSCIGFICITYGFGICNLYPINTLIFSQLFLQGLFGIVVPGILEYIKGRTFPANLYLLYGIYFSCEFYFQFYDENYNFKNNNVDNTNNNNNTNPENNNKKLNDEIKCFYYGSWAVLSFPIFIGSLQSNLFFLLQTLISFAFFIVRCNGEKKENKTLNGTVSGILELVTGFISLYICINQIVNGAFKFRAVPSVPLSQENDIDIDIKKDK